MGDLPESITMSSSGSADAALHDVAANSGSGRTNQCPDAALRKLREGGHDAAVLPQATNDNLWVEIRSTHDLSLVEVLSRIMLAPLCHGLEVSCSALSTARCAESATNASEQLLLSRTQSMCIGT